LVYTTDNLGALLVNVLSCDNGLFMKRISISDRTYGFTNVVTSSHFSQDHGYWYFSFYVNNNNGQLEIFQYSQLTQGNIISILYQNLKYGKY
jgi:hypothetical protein